MADPLSIVASITGLVALGFQVSLSVKNFAQNIKDAPSEIQRLKHQTSELAVILSSLGVKLKQDFASSPPYPIDLAHCLRDVLDDVNEMFTQLKELVEKLGPCDKNSNWDSIKIGMKVKWLESSIEKSLRYIEAYKSTLNIILIITVSFTTADIRQDTKDYKRVAMGLIDGTSSRVQNSEVLDIKSRDNIGRLLKRTETSVVAGVKFEPVASKLLANDRSEPIADAKDAVSRISLDPNSLDTHHITLEESDVCDDGAEKAPRPTNTASGELPIPEQMNGGSSPMCTFSDGSSIPDVSTETVVECISDQDPELARALRSAAWNGDTEMLTLLLDMEADIDFVDDMDGTALQMAALAGKLAAVELLLERRADPNLGGGRWNNPIIAAIHAADTGNQDPDALILKAILGARSRVDKPAFLIYAAEIKNRVALEALLKAGADVNGTNSKGTALQAAALVGRTENVKLLLLHNANPNLGAGRFTNPLVAAIHAAGASICEANKSVDLTIIELLLSKGADPQTECLLHSAVWQCLDWNPRKIEALEIVRCLLKNGAFVNSLNSLDETALYVAALHGSLEAVKILLENGADARIGKSPFQAAVSQKHTEVVKLLLKKRS